MSPPDWIRRSVSLLKSSDKKEAAAPAPRAQAAPKKGANDGRPARTLAERLEATLRRHGEAMTPRALRDALEALQSIVDARVSEVEAGRRAHDVARSYAQLPPAERRDLWLLMCEFFAPDAARLKAAREQFESAPAGSPEQGQAEVRLRRALVSPRARLLQRFAIDAEGLRFLVDLRAELLPELRKDRRLAALDAELEQLFSTWFDVAFLELQRISWDSPASLIEKLIQYEAVHDIKSWSDVKNRLDEKDRRCYGFFHPRMPGVPLIFVEVALTPAMSESILPLLDESATPGGARAGTAIFYSISNTQAGLRGVSFGDSLIKRVVETLQAEFPRLKTFATLSPIPGLRQWVGQNAAALLGRLPEKQAEALGRQLGGAAPTAERLLPALDDALALPPKAPQRQALMQFAAEYLGRALADGRPADAVARFHLGNGARVERLNWAADPSPKGMKQSWGLMVNYLYDLKRLDRHRALLAQGKVPMSGEVEALLPKG